MIINLVIQISNLIDGVFKDLSQSQIEFSIQYNLNYFMELAWKVYESEPFMVQNELEEWQY